jgi:hypothetical protein
MRQAWEAQSYGYGFSVVERMIGEGHWRILVRDVFDGGVVERADFLGHGSDIRSSEMFQKLKEKYLALY